MFLTRLKAWFSIKIRQEEKRMREMAKENKSLVRELESMVAELRDMMSCQTITEAERLDLKNKIIALFLNG